MIKLVETDKKRILNRKARTQIWLALSWKKKALSHIQKRIKKDWTRYLGPNKQAGRLAERESPLRHVRKQSAASTDICRWSAEKPVSGAVKTSASTRQRRTSEVSLLTPDSYELKLWCMVISGTSHHTLHLYIYGLSVRKLICIFYIWENKL